MAVHDDGTLGEGTTRTDRVTVHLANEEVAVSASRREPAPPSVVAHREDVVRRLLSRGLSPELLRTLVPELGGVIDRLDPS